MLGLGTAAEAPSRSRCSTARRRLTDCADRGPFGRLELRGDDAGGAVGGDPLDLDVLERGLDGLAEPLADPLRVAGDLQAGKGAVAGGAGARVLLRGRSPTATKNGSCGSAIRPLTPICFQRSSVPSGRCRLPVTASRPSRFSTRRCRRPRRPSRASRRRGRSGRARPGRTAPCRRPGGRAPRRSRGRSRRPAAGSCCGCRNGGARHRRRSPCRAGPRDAGRCRQGHRGRRRREVVQAHVRF